MAVLVCATAARAQSTGGTAATRVSAPATPTTPSSPPQQRLDTDDDDDDASSSLLVAMAMADGTGQTAAPAAQPRALIPLAAEPRLDLDLRGVGARDAFRRIFQLAGPGYEYFIHPSVTNDRTVVLSAPNVTLTTALRVVAEATGSNCTVTTRRGEPGDRTLYKLRFYITRSPGVGALTLPPISPAVWSGTVPPLYQELAGALNGPGLHTLDIPLGGRSPSGGSDRMTITCPNCKRDITLLRLHGPLHCPKCGRIFQPEWRYCPFDGTRRPSEFPAIKFCPFCGRPLDLDSK